MFSFLRQFSNPAPVVSVQPMRRNPQIDGVLLEKAQIEMNTASLEYILAGNRLRPCHCYPIKIKHDGIRWQCESAIADGAIGYGDSPGEAMTAFDKMWVGNVSMGG